MSFKGGPNREINDDKEYTREQELEWNTHNPRAELDASREFCD